MKARKEEMLEFQSDPRTEVRPTIQQTLMHTIHTDEVIYKVIFRMNSVNHLGSANIKILTFEMIFEALKFEKFKFKFHSLSPKIVKIPEFDLIVFDKMGNLILDGFATNSITK